MDLQEKIDRADYELEARIEKIIQRIVDVNGISLLQATTMLETELMLKTPSILRSIKKSLAE